MRSILGNFPAFDPNALQPREKEALRKRWQIEIKALYRAASTSPGIRESLDAELEEVRERFNKLFGQHAQSTLEIVLQADREEVSQDEFELGDEVSGRLAA